MLAYVLRRVLLMIPTLIGALTITFVVMQFVPGGPVEQVMAEARAGAIEGRYKAGRDLDKQRVEELKKLYGFDKPAHVRYFEMLGSFARFDLGRSFMQNKDVWQLIKEKLPVSISLGMWTFLVSYLVSIPLGVAKAVREGTRFDAVTTLFVKNTFVEEMRKQYVLVARAKGLSDGRVLYKHIFRNALIPLITGFPAAFIGAFFAGSVLIETLFSLDGLGLLAFESVVRRDYPVVLGSLYLFTLIALVVKLIADLLYVVVDPRVQFASVGR